MRIQYPKNYHLEMDNESDWELSKENIKPLTQGRQARCLSLGLSESQQSILSSERQKFEEKLRCNNSNDPLELWYQYALWVEQNYPKGGNEGKFRELLENCFKALHSTGDLKDKYSNDERLLDLFVKFTHECSHPLRVFAGLKNKGYFTGLSKFYEYYAMELEVRGAVNKAKCIYLEGIKQLAQPIRDLEATYSCFLRRTGGVDSTRDEAGDAEGQPKRAVLGVLGTVGPKCRAPVERDNLSQVTPGVYNAGVAQKSNTHQFNVYQGVSHSENVPPDKENGMFVGHKAESKENTKSASQWTQNRLKQRSVTNIPVKEVDRFVTTPFTVYVDDTKPESKVQTQMAPPSTVLSVKKVSTEACILENVPLFIAEPYDPKKKSMYPKHLVYCGTEEFSPEEIIAASRRSKGQDQQKETVAPKSPSSANSSKFEASMTVNTKYANKIVADFFSGTLLNTPTRSVAARPSKQTLSSATSQPVSAFSVYEDEAINCVPTNKPAFAIDEAENIESVPASSDGVAFVVYEDKKDDGALSSCAPFTVHEDKMDSGASSSGSLITVPVVKEKNSGATPNLGFNVFEDKKDKDVASNHSGSIRKESCRLKSRSNEGDSDFPSACGFTVFEDKKDDRSVVNDPISKLGHEKRDRSSPKCLVSSDPQVDNEAKSDPVCKTGATAKTFGFRLPQSRVKNPEVIDSPAVEHCVDSIYQPISTRLGSAFEGDLVKSPVTGFDCNKDREEARSVSNFSAREEESKTITNLRQTSDVRSSQIPKSVSDSNLSLSLKCTSFVPKAKTELVFPDLDEDKENVPPTFTARPPNRRLSGVLQPSNDIPFVPLEQQADPEGDDDDEQFALEDVADANLFDDITFKIPERFSGAAMCAVSTPLPGSRDKVPQVDLLSDDFTMAIMRKKDKVGAVPDRNLGLSPVKEESKEYSSSSSSVSSVQTSNFVTPGFRPFSLRRPQQKEVSATEFGAFFHHSRSSIKTCVEKSILRGVEVENDAFDAEMDHDMEKMLAEMKEQMDDAENEKPTAKSHMTKSGLKFSFIGEGGPPEPHPPVTSESAIVRDGSPVKLESFVDRTDSRASKPLPLSVPGKHESPFRKRRDLREEARSPSYFPINSIPAVCVSRVAAREDFSSAGESNPAVVPADYNSSLKSSSLSDIDPFCPNLRQDLLRKLALPVDHRKGFVNCAGKFPVIKAKSIVRLMDESYQVMRQCGSGAYAKVFYATTVDPMDVTLFPSAQLNDEKSNKSQMVLKVQKPADAWEFYVCHELRTRLKRAREDGSQRPPPLDSFQRFNRAYFFDQGSVLISAFGAFGTVLDLVNDYTKNNQTLPESIAIIIIAKLLKCVERLHGCKFIHADLKPDNILITQTPKWDLDDAPEVGFIDHCPDFLQLIDFGRTIDMNLLPSGTVFTQKITTDGFACCEMRDGRPWTFQTDLYGVAATAYVLLWGVYMETTKCDGVWTLKNIKYKRNMNQELWCDFFGCLLNCKSCTELPDLNIIIGKLEQALRQKSIRNLKMDLHSLSLVLKRKKI